MSLKLKGLNTIPYGSFADSMKNPTHISLFKVDQLPGIGILEINPRHPLVKKLAEAKDSNPELAKLVALQLLDNALIAAGLLEDARDTVSRMNKLMEKAMG
jgi:HSP90 family molecular chaperone